ARAATSLARLPCFTPTSCPTATASLSLHDALPISDGARMERSGDDLRRQPRREIAGVDAARGRVRRPGERASIGIDNRFRADPRDRKSTRLNSSHVAISYAVFCLKKKNYSSHRMSD